MKRVIWAQAFPRNSVMVWLMDHAPNVIEHLVKIWLYPKHESVNHWIGEVHAFMPRVPKMVKKGVPDKDFIMRYTYNGYADIIPAAVEEAQETYGYVSDIDIQALDAWVKSYFQWFSTSLDTEGRISRQAVNNWIQTSL